MKTILVGIDMSPRSEGVLREADALAAALGAKLAIVHCVQVPPELPVSLWTAPADRFLEQVREGSRREIDALVRAIPRERLASVTVEIGVPWRALLEEARALDADLVVIGAHGYGLLDRILGTTAAKIIDHADRPVLVVRPRPLPPSPRRARDFQEERHEWT
jgi:nucleotide-binding universal stress UspA family protein